MINKLNAYIVDDNLMNNEILKELINKHYPYISIIGEAKNEKEFIDLLILNEADLIFLDIELGEEKTSLEILNEFGNIDSEIIIISSSKEYALNAMNEHNITSYVLKPLDLLKLHKSIKKIEQKIGREKKLVHSEDSFNMSENLVAIPNMNSIELIDFLKIFYLEADGRYTEFHLDDGTKKVVSKNIGYYEDILPKKIFFRIHHKFIININKIDSIIKTDGFYCLFKNGKTLSISKRRVDDLRKFLHLK